MNELNPDAGSADELEAIRANQGSTGPQAPDVVDIALGLAPEAKEEGLLQPYMVETWDYIPDDAKDAEGYWYGDYYGVLAFEVNADVVENVPQTWADLLKPEYNGQIALAGDPRVSGQAIAAVFAAASGQWWLARRCPGRFRLLRPAGGVGQPGPGYRRVRHRVVG